MSLCSVTSLMVATFYNYIYMLGWRLEAAGLEAEQMSKMVSFVVKKESGEWGMHALCI